MIRNLLKGSMPIFFIGAAAGLCLFSFTFAGAIEHVVLERANGLALMFAFVGGFCGGWTEMPGSESAARIPAWKRVLRALLAIFTGAVAFALMAFSMSYAGVIEHFITMFASVMGVLFSLFCGFATNWTLASSSVPTHSEQRMTSASVSVLPRPAVQVDEDAMPSQPLAKSA
jgi:hypothetical protein